MSLSQDQHNRADLPIVPPVGEPDDPGIWDYLDGWHLHRQGLIDPALMTARAGDEHLPAGTRMPLRWLPADNWEQLQTILDQTGQRGAYQAHIRANGVVRVCPDWCEDDHPRAAIYDPDGMEEGVVYHTRTLWGMSNRDDERDTHAFIRCELWQGKGYDGTPPNLFVEAEGQMTAAQVRQFAAALLNAADHIEGTTP